jgi:hypothetical protein
MQVRFIIKVKFRLKIFSILWLGPSFLKLGKEVILKENHITKHCFVYIILPFFENKFPSIIQ